MRLFNKFPASSNMGREDLVSKFRDYCETVEGCDPVDVEAACRELARVDSPFIPSAGQIYAAAQRAAASRVAKERSAVPRLAPRVRGIDAVPEADRAAVKRRFAELLASLRNGTAQ